MSPALNGSSAIRHFKGSNAIEMCDGITFNFYTGLPHLRQSLESPDVCNNARCKHKRSHVKNTTDLYLTVTMVTIVQFVLLTDSGIVSGYNLIVD